MLDLFLEQWWCDLELEDITISPLLWMKYSLIILKCTVLYCKEEPLFKWFTPGEPQVTDGPSRLSEGTWDSEGTHVLMHDPTEALSHRLEWECNESDCAWADLPQVQLKMLDFIYEVLLGTGLDYLEDHLSPVVPIQPMLSNKDGHTLGPFIEVILSGGIQEACLFCCNICLMEWSSPSI